MWQEFDGLLHFAGRLVTGHRVSRIRINRPR
ncbi:hypothetical protein RHECNPAF_2940030 [Rhizobium etli CNPAF512]|nr:hypothetical protein RHECNPAF_2940030 [Rhizobium etli CNPAF512]